VKYLIDTHTALWWLFAPDRLSTTARKVILDNTTELSFSAASYWEICIKISLKKLEVGTKGPAKIRDELTRNQVQWLAIEPEHCDRLLRLPFHHRDPFDRLLVVQAQSLGANLLSADDALDSYSIRRVW
jgi:PIN domain nuclease of toxin-antitoxin system